MWPQSQFILIVILIVLALVLLNWEANNNFAHPDESSDDPSQSEQRIPNHDSNQISS